MGSAIWIAAAAGLVCICSASADAGDRRQFSGVAAFYDLDYSGQTAAGERYDPAKFTAAHRTLPFGTKVRVTNMQTHRSVVVTINDRGPFNNGRVLDLSLAAAKSLRMTDSGIVKVTARVQNSVMFTTAAKLQAR